jgi:hypothetical protein
MAEPTDPLEPRGEESYDLRWAVTELTERRAGLDERWDYYEGTQPEVFMSDKIARAMARLSRHFRFNYARTVVTAIMDRLNPDAYVAADNAAQTALDDLLDDVAWEDLEAEARELALVHGDAYLIVWPEEFAAVRVAAQDTTADDNELELELAEARAVSIELEPATSMTAQYHPRRKSELRFAARTWSEDGLRYHELYYPNRLERWVETAKRSGQYMLDPTWEDAGTWTYPDAMPETVPVFPLSTRRAGYGRSAHEDAIGPQSTVDKLVTGLMATIDYSGAPIRYGLMHEQDAAGAGYDDLEDDGQDVEVVDGTNTSSLRSGPGDFWLLNLAEVGQFAQATVSTYLEPWASAVRNMASITATPIHLFEGFAGDVSGEAIRSAEAPLVKKVNKLQRLFGRGEIGALEYALELLGTPATVDIVWEPAQFAGDADAWGVAASKVALGIPLRHVLIEQGYTPEVLDELGITNEAGNVADPNTLATLVSRLAVAVPTVLSARQARRIVEVAMGLQDSELELDDDHPELVPPEPEPVFA